MDKFSKIKKKKKEKKLYDVLYDAEYFTVKKKDNYVFIDESDSICVVPILIQQNRILLRAEYIPSFNIRDNQERHLTCISGTIEEGENPENCLRRELVEEAGIILRDDVVVEFFDVLYKSKTGSSQFHLCILPLMDYQYEETIASGDGSDVEEMSRTVTVENRHLNNLFPSDIVTKLLISEVKKELNIQ